MRTAIDDLGRLDRAVAEHREFLEHDLEVGVVGDQLLHVGLGAAAVAAVVVEELDQRDVALRVADHHLARRGEEELAVVADRGDLRGLLRGVLLALQFVDRVADDLGIGDQVVADELGIIGEVVLDDPLDLAPLLVAELRRPSPRRRRRGVAAAVIGRRLVASAPAAPLASRPVPTK